MKNKIIFTALAITSAGAVALGTNSVAAQTVTDTHPPIVQKIAQRFGLQESDVQAVFDEERRSHQEELESQMQLRLTQAVTDGKITEDQKSAVIAKHEEMQAQRETEMKEWKNKTPEERKQSMETRRQELDQWAEQNGLTFSDLLFGRHTMKMKHL